MAKLAGTFGDQAANYGHDRTGHRLADVGPSRWHLDAPENGLVAALLGKPDDRPVNRVDGASIALVFTVAPGEEAVGLQNDALGIRAFLGPALHPHPELEARASPRQPADLLPVDLRGDLFGFGRGRDRDHRIRVHVVDITGGQETVERRVDRGRAWVQVEGAVVIELHHFVLHLRPRITLAEQTELVEIERGEAVEFHRTQAAAGALHPEHV